jgi:hypothetical protein
MDFLVTPLAPSTVPITIVHKDISSMASRVSWGMLSTRGISEAVMKSRAISPAENRPMRVP